MELKSQRDGNALTITLSGELNTLTASDLETFLEKELTDSKTLTLDFAGCGYVSSAGIRVLLATFKYLKAEGGNMYLKNVDENFMEVLENTELDTVFEII